MRHSRARLFPGRILRNHLHTFLLRHPGILQTIPKNIQWILRPNYMIMPYVHITLCSLTSSFSDESEGILKHAPQMLAASTGCAEDKQVALTIFLSNLKISPFSERNNFSFVRFFSHKRSNFEPDTKHYSNILISHNTTSSYSSYASSTSCSSITKSDYKNRNVIANLGTTYQQQQQQCQLSQRIK